ncbi:MAG: glutaredoxin family protein [Planctomycetota bacterium]
MWNADKVKETIESDKIVLFAKGSRMQPMCGFSARAMDILSSYGKPFTVVNIFDDPEIRPALVSYSQWPTTPQVFVAGELLGGSDTALELHENGDLKKKIDAAFA